MGESTINGLATELVTPGPNDLIGVWDVAAGQFKKAKCSAVVGAVITGGGTIALAGNTLAVPASGTAALLGVAQAFTAPQTFVSPINAGGIAATGIVMAIGNIQNLNNFTPITNGLLFLIDSSGTQVALFRIAGGANQVQEVLDPNNTFAAAADISNSINVFYSAGYKVQNNRAYSTTLRVLAIGS